MLCSAFPPGTAPYKRSYYNHPCTIWVRESKQNYEWLLQHADGLSKEYTFRYGKYHKCNLVLDWCNQNYYKLKLPEKGLTKFAQAMPDQYKNKDAVLAYRQYYLNEKARIAKWVKGRQQPDWWIL